MLFQTHNIFISETEKEMDKGERMLNTTVKVQKGRGLSFQSTPSACAHYWANVQLKVKSRFVCVPHQASFTLSAKTHSVCVFLPICDYGDAVYRCHLQNSSLWLLFCYKLTVISLHIRQELYWLSFLCWTLFWSEISLFVNMLQCHSYLHPPECLWLLCLQILPGHRDQLQKLKPIINSF